MKNVQQIWTNSVMELFADWLQYSYLEFFNLFLANRCQPAMESSCTRLLFQNNKHCDTADSLILKKIYERISLKSKTKKLGIPSQRLQ